MNWLFLYVAVSVLVGAGFALGFYLDEAEWVKETRGVRIVACTFLWLAASILWPFAFVFAVSKKGVDLVRRLNKAIAGD